MRIGIYSEPSGGGVGGAESSVAALAEALSDLYQVEIVHHRRDLSTQRLAAVSGVSLQKVHLRYAAPEPFSFGSSHVPWRRYRDAQRWRARLSEPYDLFINFTHGFPPFCRASAGILVVLFPVNDAPYKQADDNDGSLSARRLIARRVKLFYHRWEWRKRMDSYQTKVTISRFSQEWTRRRWGIDCQIVYPPVDTDFAPAQKLDLILSVGRFAKEGHSKKQAEMMAAFRRLKDARRQCWDYMSVGSLGDAPEDRALFESVKQSGGECGAQVLANVGRKSLKQYFTRAKLFWHAAGYDEGDDRPELAEHFGIVTAEAMSAGCVPVVINKGGQPEIVQHGVNGFLWNTLDELEEYSLLLMRDSQLRERMAEAARSRARLFSREQFLAGFRKILPSGNERFLKSCAC